MVETERESFTVSTIGTGQPDYSQPTLAPAALVVKFPEREIAGKRYQDFAQIAFTATQQVYVIGTNANNNLAGSWPTNIVAKEIQFYTTTACWIRINSATAVPQLIPGLLPLRFFSRVTRIYVYQDTVPGTLYAWIEG